MDWLAYFQFVTKTTHFATFLSLWFYCSKKGFLEIEVKLKLFLVHFSEKERIKKFLIFNKNCGKKGKMQIMPPSYVHVSTIQERVFWI